MQLPNRPNLRHLSKQAKRLLDAHRAGDVQAAERIKAHLPRLSRQSPQAILSAELTLQEAQHVLAVEYGFSGWKTLADYVNAQLLNASWNFSDRVHDEISKATMNAFKEAEREVYRTRKVVKIPIDAEFELEEPDRRYEVKVRQITRIPLWDTPEQRESDIEFTDNTDIDANISGDGNTGWTKMPDRELWEWSNKVDDGPLQTTYETFAQATATNFSQASGIEVEIPHWSQSHTEACDFISALIKKPHHLFRFTVQPTRGLAAIALPTSLTASLLNLDFDRDNPNLHLTPQDSQRLEEILSRLLNDLATSWHPIAQVECTNLTPLDKPQDLDIALYEERIKTVQYLAQSKKVSRFFYLCFPRTVLVPILPEREENE